MSTILVVIGMLLCAASGVVGLAFGRRSVRGQKVATAIISAGCLLGLGGVAFFWWSSCGMVSDDAATGPNVPQQRAEPVVMHEIKLPWAVPGGEFRVGVDGLSALFLLPIFLIALLGSIYGLSYWKQSEQPATGRKLRLFYGLLAAGMALLVIARNGLVFLLGWEIMALSAFFLVITEDHDAAVREVGWIYFVTTHTSTLALFAVFALLGSIVGSFDLRAVTAEEADEAGPRVIAMILVMSLIAFGIKAGMMPGHVWLPSAHAITPSHVSAIMSGVIIKMGIYGLVRVTGLLPRLPPAWGTIVLALGVISGVLGVAYALGQHDLKRLLAYHSIENIGIIVMGLGLALLGRSLNRPEWLALGLGGALLHVWNHAFFKSLLFFSAGSVVHATHTREIDHLGGLARTMPRTAFCFLVGAVAICGLPPLNGFVSEFLIYLGLFRVVDRDDSATFISAALAIPALALIGALASACFVKAFGAVFLGTPRSEHATHARESDTTMIGPMLVLVICCAIIGLAPMVVAPILMLAVHAWAPPTPDGQIALTALAPLGWITALGLGLTGAIAVTSLGLRKLLARRCEVVADAATTAPTWSCGYTAPTLRMQYTSSSFAQLLVGLFAWALRPKGVKPAILGLFPRTSMFQSDVPDAVLDEGLLPTLRGGAWLCGWARVFQQGSIQMYLLYIIVTLLVLLVWR